MAFNDPGVFGRFDLAAFYAATPCIYLFVWLGVQRVGALRNCGLAVKGQRNHSDLCMN
jgi:hypothetical protein